MMHEAWLKLDESQTAIPAAIANESPSSPILSLSSPFPWPPRCSSTLMTVLAVGKLSIVRF